MVQFLDVRSFKRCLWCAVVGSVLLLGWPGALLAEPPTPVRPAAAKAAPAKAVPTPRAAPKVDAKAAPKAAAKAAPKAAAKAAPADVRAAASNAFKTVDLNALKVKPGWDRPYLLAAYGVVWVVLMLYVFSLARRMRDTDIALADIRARMQTDSDD